MNIVIKNVRFSFAHVWEKDEKGKYSVAILIPKDSPQIKDIEEAIKEAAEAGKGTLGNGFKLKMEKTLQDGDEKGMQDYEGMFYLNAKSGLKPGVVKKNTTGIGGSVIAITDPEEFYSGCYGAAQVHFYAFSKDGNKGIAVGLDNVLKTQDGPKLGGGPSAESAFGELVDDLPSEDDEDMF